MNLPKALAQIFPKERLKTRLIDLIAYSSDAGFYQLTPKAVVQPINISEIKALFAFSQKHRIPLTFRTAGTSLSGQSVTDGILADVSCYWRKVKPEENGNIVRVQPGVIGATVNLHLKKYGKKIGPDPASINSCMMGGILSNNSSGMCCGVQNNSYHTLRYLHFVLPNGQEYHTEKPEDYERFLQESPAIAQKLSELRERLLNNSALLERIRYKYGMKNTVGYSINALADFEHPLDILVHLIIGAEGTLAFIAEGVLQTILDYPQKATAMLYFSDIYSACEAIKPLWESGAEALELMDRPSLRAVENIAGVPEIIKSLPKEATAILCEYQTSTVEELDEKITLADKLCETLPLLEKPKFTKDANIQAFLWKLRKGLIPSVGAMRKSGTTVVFEDVTFPLPHLAKAVVDMQELFAEHHYEEGIIFGHAKDGNIHFVVTQSFNTAQEIERYARFMDDLVDMVVRKYDGALKAEHGTGRNMAPFVETEWGPEAYQIMKEIKNTLDPDKLLNPGVLINEDKETHIKNLKSLPEVEQEVDKCIECGFCEKNCPSRDLSLTPRRRIIIRRALAKFRASGDKKRIKKLSKQYQYDGLATCAVDGLCATDCPVNINTGDLVKRLRNENHSVFQNQTALFLARNFVALEKAIKLSLKIGHFINALLGKKAMPNLTFLLRKAFPALPLWSRQLPQLPKSLHHTDRNPAFVYFPTCISRVMGNSMNEKAALPETLLKVAQKAGIELFIPVNIGYCCGQAFSSKGFKEANTFVVNKTIASLWEWSQEGKLPVILDGSSCSYTLQHCESVLNEDNILKFRQLKIIDSVDFIADEVLPKLKIKKSQKPVVLHPVCSLTKMNIREKFIIIAKACAEEADIPLSAGCCGMAGDRGFLFPELTQSATAQEAAEVKQKDYAGYYASAKTCEMALSENVGKNYESIIYLVNEVSEAG